MVTRRVSISHHSRSQVLLRIEFQTTMCHVYCSYQVPWEIKKSSNVCIWFLIVLTWLDISVLNSKIWYVSQQFLTLSLNSHFQNGFQRLWQFKIHSALPQSKHLHTLGKFQDLTQASVCVTCLSCIGGIIEKTYFLWPNKLNILQVIGK